MKSLRSTWRLRIVLALAVLAFAGCSPEARLARHLERAQEYFAANDRRRAEVEYLNVLRDDARHVEALARLGQIYFEQGRQQRAAPYLGTARNLAPQDLETRRRLGLLLLAAGKTAEARAEASAVLDARPDDAEAMLLLAETSLGAEPIAAARERLAAAPAGAGRETALGVLAMRERDVASAGEHLRQAVALDPASDLAQATLASFLAASGDLPGASAAYARVAAIAPARSPRRILAAQFFLRRGEIDAAKKLLDDTLATAPDYLPAATWRAEVALLEKDWADTERRVRAVLAVDPAFVDAQTLGARLRLAQGEYAQAETILRRLVDAYPQSPQLHYLLALAQNAGPDNAAAVGTLTHALTLDPGYVEAALLLASINTRRGDAASAAVAMQQLTRRNPRLVEAWLLLVEAYQRQGNPAAAQQTLAEARQRFPDKPQFATMAGIIHRQQGRPAEAAAAFAEALRINPGFALAREQLITLDLDARRFEAAAQRASEFVTAFPDQPEPHLLNARVAAAQGDRAAAEAALRKVIAIRPDHATAYLQLARLFIDAGRSDEALHELEQAAQRDPGEVSLQMLLGTLLQQRHDIPRARAAYEQAIKLQPRFVAALNNLAYIYSENDHDYDRAYAMADRARKLAPLDPFVQDTFGWILHQRGQFAWAKAMLLESAAKLTEEPEVQLHLGLTHYMLAEEAEALTALRAYLASGPTGPAAEDARRCVALLEAGRDSGAARELIAACRQRRPNDPVAALRLAAILEAEQQHDEAAATYEEILRAFPKHPRLRVEFARFLQRRGDLARAYALVKSIPDEAPDDVASARATGRFAYLAGEFVRAANLLRDCARRQPAEAEIQQDLADALFAIGELSAAETALRAALAVGLAADRVPAARQQLALLTFLNNAPATEPPAEVGPALAADPQSGPALLVTLLLRERAGDLAAATRAGEELARRFPECHVASVRLAGLLLDQPGREEQAFALAQKVRTQQPGNPAAARVLGVLAYRKGDYGRATTLLSESTGRIEGDAHGWYLLGASLHQLKRTPESRAALQRALALGLGDEDAAEANRLLAGVAQATPH